MIIGKNNNQPSFNTNFDQRFNTVKENTKNNNSINTGMHENIQTMAHSDITNNNEMRNKSFAMLQERLNNGLISIEEFNRKVNELNKNNM